MHGARKRKEFDGTLIPCTLDLAPCPLHRYTNVPMGFTSTPETSRVSLIFFVAVLGPGIGSFEFTIDSELTCEGAAGGKG